MMPPFDCSIRNICFVRTAGTGDTEVFNHVLDLCLKTGARLSIVTVLHDHPKGYERLLASWSVPAEAITGEADESAECERMAEVGRSRGVDVSSEQLRGVRFLEVCRKVMRDKHDLLIKTAEPTQAVQRVLLGHTDRQLIRKCPCPVWIEKPSSGKSHNRILAAVDPAPFLDDSDGGSVRMDLNTSILQFSQLLTELEQAELHVVYSWSFELETLLRTRAGLTGEAVAEVAETFRQKHETALAALISPYRSFISHVHLVNGHAGEEIARVAARESIDIIVMGTLCRSGLGGFLIGNTAETVLDHADCSIVALKPQGFVTPVYL